MSTFLRKQMTRGFLFFALVSTAFLGAEVPKICLTMIVKNESAVIERCLSSVKGIADCVCICDTGSTDATVETVEKYLKNNSIPGKVYHHEWMNFGHNRSLSAKAAQELIAELGFSPQSTYLLLLDADMVLKTSEGFDKDKLTLGAYHLKQKNGTLSYPNIRLLKASLPWECKGPTHEYWSCAIPHREGKLDTASIDDRNDGGCKSDKFERDVRLLTKGLEEEPNNPRYMFYLAQSYMCLEKYDEAIQWYQKRMEFNDSTEECWFSRFMLGECFAGKKDWDKALHWYLEAFQYRPTRSEPLAAISLYYREKGLNELAYFFAKKGLAIPYPKEDLLFVIDSVYQYELDTTVSIAAYYCKNGWDDGVSSLERLLLRKTTPEDIRRLAYNNLRFYLKPLPNVSFRPILFPLPKVSATSNLSYFPTNPSIVKTESGYAVICRTVNYVQEKGTNYHSVDFQDPTVRTRNFLLTYSKDWRLLSQKEIIEQLPRKKYEGSSVVGLEDCRLFMKTPQKLCFMCTTHDTHPRLLPQIVLCGLDGSGEVAHVDSFLPLKGPYPDRCEKNWLPFYKDGALHAIYSYEPFTVLRVDEESGECTREISYESQHNFSSFRGSAGPIPFDNGYLIIVHEVIFLPTQERIYTHRFVFLDKEFKIQKVSRPFCFKHEGVEYCCGMTLDHEEKKLLITCGIEDSSAYIASVDVKTVRSVLRELP